MSAYTQTIARAIRKGSDVLTGDDAAVLERDLTEYQDTADTLRADNERLREALAAFMSFHDQLNSLRDRAALAGKDGAE